MIHAMTHRGITFAVRGSGHQMQKYILHKHRIVSLFIKGNKWVQANS